MEGTEQPTAPYLDAVGAYAFRGTARYHVPGHKGGPGADPGLRKTIGVDALAADRCGMEVDRRMMRFEDFDLGTFMVSEIPPERLGPKVDEILSVLRANPALYEALGAYFAHDLDIASTAESLHMHRNSLRYRLARAEQLLGRSLKQPSAIAAVYLALVAEAGEQSRAASLD